MNVQYNNHTDNDPDYGQYHYRYFRDHIHPRVDITAVAANKMLGIQYSSYMICRDQKENTAEAAIKRTFFLVHQGGLNADEAPPPLDAAHYMAQEDSVIPGVYYRDSDTGVLHGGITAKLVSILKLSLQASALCRGL